MTDRARRKRLNDVAAAKRRHDAKMRDQGFSQSQVWLNDQDRKHASLIGQREQLATLSEIVSFALAESAASGSDARPAVQADQNDAQEDVQSIDNQ